MRVFRIWHILLFLASSCENEIEYEGNYVDNYGDPYGNEISEDQQEVVSPSPCQAADFSRWDKLFLSLEDSHMRQNMLLDSLEQCCGGTERLRARVEELMTRWRPSVESACGAQVEQLSIRLQQELEELREKEEERQTRLNATLLLLQRSIHEGNMRLKRLEEDRATKHKPTAGPGGWGSMFSLGMKPFPSGLKEQEVTTPMYATTMERALVAMTTELEKVHLQLNRVMDQVKTLRRDRGDT